MSRQRKIEEWALGAYADGELSGEAAAEIEALLRDDPEAQHALADLRRQKAALKQAFDPVLAEEIPPAIKNAVAQAHVSQWRQAARRFLLIGSLAAAVALIMHAVDVREFVPSEGSTIA